MQPIQAMTYRKCPKVKAVSGVALCPQERAGVANLSLSPWERAGVRVCQPRQTDAALRKYLGCPRPTVKSDSPPLIEVPSLQAAQPAQPTHAALSREQTCSR